MSDPTALFRPDDLRACLQLSLAGLRDPVIVTDTDNRVTFLNQPAEALLGWSAIEAIGLPCVFHLVDDESGEALAEPVDVVLRERRVVALGERAALCTRGGGRVPVEGCASPLLDAQGRILGALVVLRDVSERWRTHAALRELTERYELVLAGSEAGLWDWDLRRKRVVYSHPWKAMRGYADHEVGDRLDAWTDGIHPDDAPRVLAAVEAHVAGDTPVFAEEYRVRRKDGSWLWVADRGLARRDARGRVIRMARSERDISGRKEAEAQLRFQAGVLAQISDAVITVDGEARVTYLNRAAEERYGVAAAEALGRPLTALYTYRWLRPEDEAAALRALAAEGRWRGENLHITRDGREIHVESTVAALRDEGGASVGLLATMRDVTERKRAEHHARFLGALQRALAAEGDPQALTQRALEALRRHLGADLASWSEITPDGAALVARQEARDGHPGALGPHQVAEYLSEEARAALVHGEALIIADVAVDPRTAAGVERFRRLGIAAFMEEPLRKSDGPRAVVAVAMARPRAWRPDEVGVLRDAAAHIFAAVERARAEQALRASEERFRGAFAHAAIGLAMATLDGRFLEGNPAYCELTGYDLEALRSLRFTEQIHPDDVAENLRLNERLVAGEFPSFVIENRYIRRDGRVVWVRKSVSLVRDEAGAPRHFLALIEDISERKRIEEVLRAANEELEEADRRKDEFLAMLAHELRNPLAAIYSAIQLIGQLGLEHPLLARALRAAERQGRHMTRLLDDLLDVSRVRHRRVALRREVVDVAAFLESAAEAAAPQVLSRHQALTVTLPPAPLRVFGDPVRLAQVVGNLLHNASRYTPLGGHIWLSAAAEAARVAIRVRDDGAGIAPELLPHVFDLFFQGDAPPGDAQAGLGIGLTVAKRLCELHGGQLEVRSDGPGTGCEFTIWLPARADPAALASPGCERDEHGCPLRVLVVDDNLDAADMLALTLEGRGYDVAVAHDGPRALELAARRRPDIALIDIGMPGMDGHEVARRMRRAPALAGVRLLALTGYGQAQDQARAREAGFDGHLVKPATIEAIERALRAPPAEPESEG